MKLEPQEIGSIKDEKGNIWDVYAHLFFYNGKEDELLLRGLILELKSKDGEQVLDEIVADSLANLPSYFKQRDIDNFENNLMFDERQKYTNEMIEEYQESRNQD